MDGHRKAKPQRLQKSQKPPAPAASADANGQQNGKADWLPTMHAGAMYIINGCPAVICGIHMDGTTNFINPAGEEVTGYRSHELLGKNWWTTFYPGEEYRQVEQLFRAFEREDVRDYEMVLTRKDGQRRLISWNAINYRDSTGRILQIIGFGIDVTTRRAAEESLRKERQLLQRLLDLQERDRRLVAYEIHDGFVQQVTAALLHFQACQHHIECTARASDEFQQGLRLLRQSIDEARHLISGLRPPILDESGLVAAIDYLACEGQAAEGIAIEFKHRGELTGLASTLESTLFRVIQEAVANACRHSQSERIRIDLTRENCCIRIEVQDWGIGFDPARVEENRFGLQSIRERARLLGGQATIDSAPGCGARVIVELPILETNTGPVSA